MTFFETEARISKDPIVGLVKKSAADESPDKLVAVLGSATDDAGNLLVPQAVMDASNELIKKGLNLAYAPSSGISHLGEKMTGEILGPDLVKKLQEAGVNNSPVVCTGGTNAISTMLMACTTEDDTIITHAPHWPGFDSIMLSLGRKPLVNFNMLNPQGKFNIEGLKKRIKEAAEKKSKITIILNAPFDNPTGQDFGEEAWQAIGKALAEYSDREILLILDTAYIDFGPKGKDYRRLRFLLDLFKTIDSPNFNLAIAGSVSKSFAMYGSRVGVATLFSSNNDNVKNWSNVIGGIIRGTFSNSSRHGQEIALSIFADHKKLANVHTFQELTVDLITKRNNFLISSFITKANIANEQLNNGKIIQVSKHMQILEPDGGFFTSIRLSNEDYAEKLSDKLLESHTYVPVVSGTYLRIPTCGLREELLDTLSSRIMACANEIE